jgi:conjugative transfer signal peptidase TraF
MISTRHCTAENPMGSLAQRTHSQRLEGARGPIGTMVGIAMATALLVAAGNALGLLISNTGSAAPAGVYRVVSNRFTRGDLVAACLPVAIAQKGVARGYLRTGGCPGGAEPVGKIIGALPGDIVEIEPGWVAVNGVRFSRSGVAARDSARRPLAHVAWGRHRVVAGQVWLFGFNDRRSWDSRYFGPVPRASVHGELEPILTW